MRLELATSLESRDGTVTKDAVGRNAIAEVAGEHAALLKRPGTNPSSFNFTTPQAFSSLADLMIQLEYGTFPVIGNMLFTLNGDSWGFTDMSTAVWGVPTGGGSGGSLTWHSVGSSLPVSVPSIYGYSQIVLFNGIYYAWDLSQDNNMYTSTDLVTWAATNLTSPYRVVGPSIIFGGRVHVWDAINVNASICSFSNALGTDWNYDVLYTGPTACDQFVQLGSTVFAMNKVAGTGFFSSTNMVSWSTVTNNLITTGTYRYKYIAFLGKIWAFPDAGRKEVYSSTDGATWTLETSDWGMGSLNYGAITIMGGLLYYIGGYTNSPTTANTSIWSSADGKIWTPVVSDFPGRGAEILIPVGSDIFSFGGDDVIGGSIPVRYEVRKVTP